MSKKTVRRQLSVIRKEFVKLPTGKALVKVKGRKGKVVSVLTASGG